MVQDAASAKNRPGSRKKGAAGILGEILRKFSAGVDGTCERGLDERLCPQHFEQQKNTPYDALKSLIFYTDSVCSI